MLSFSLLFGRLSGLIHGGGKVSVVFLWGSVGFFLVARVFVVLSCLWGCSRVFGDSARFFLDSARIF